MSALFRPVATFATMLALAGCASMPPERGYTETRDLILRQRALPSTWSPLQPDLAPALPERPLTVDDAVVSAFFRNPSLREEYARLGIGRAELEDARRLANPTLGYARLSPRDGEGVQIARSVSLGLTDLLLLPSRKRLAEGELERLQHAVAGAALKLATEVEIAWYRAVAARQVAAMRDLVAIAAERSAALAQRFFDAGNINRLQLEQERAAASMARIDAVSAAADALRARSDLAALLGLSTGEDWETLSLLPAPRAIEYDADALLALAMETRLDLSAARRSVDVREDALKSTRRWRWLGDVEIGYERESELDGGTIRGPTASLQLPIFNQGQGAVARAEAELLQARAEFDAARLSVQNETRLGLDALQVAHTIAESYRTQLVPEREAIVARTQEQVNYMLVGVFELLLAKQQEYDAYQAYLEAVRDYWIARAELRGAVGGRLPDDDVATEATIGVDSLLTPMAEPPPDPHAGHGQHHADESDSSHESHESHESRESRESHESDESDESEHQHHHGDQP